MKRKSPSSVGSRAKTKGATTRHRQFTRSIPQSALSSQLAVYSATVGAFLGTAALPAKSEAAVTLITAGSLNWESLPVGPSNPPFLPLNATHSGFSASAAFVAPNIVGYFRGRVGPANSNNASLKGDGNIFFFADRGNSLLNLQAGDALAGATATTGVLGRLTSLGVQGHFTAAHQTGYIGFRFNAAALYNGWFHVKVAWEDNSPVSITLIPKVGTTDVYGAYGSNGEITTAGAIPEPAHLGGLGLLALGAIGVRELRKRRATVQAS